MVLIYHGDNIEASRSALNDYLDKLQNIDILRFDQKEIDPIKINLILNSQSLIPQSKTLVLFNLFSLTKTLFDQTHKLLSQASDTDIILWQDKNLTAAQLKSFPDAKISQFKADNRLYACLNSITPGNVSGFTKHYQNVISDNLFDLFLYLLKGQLRRHLSGFSRFDSVSLKKSYLQLIEMEYLYKSGQLSLSKDIALERIILNLIK